MDFEYLEPSLKMWPTSTALPILRGLPLVTSGSPSFTLRMSAMRVQVKSRPGVMLR